MILMKVFQMPISKVFFLFLIMQIMKSPFILMFFLFVLISCGEDYGHEIHGGELTVYFTDRSDEKLAEGVANYWKEHELLTGKKQDLRLVKDGDWYTLHIIANHPEEIMEMRFEERKELLDMQQDLQIKLGEHNLQIVLSDNRFKEIYNINE